MKASPFLVFLLLFVSCEENLETSPNNASFYLGADLSYVNEMIDCGAVYKDFNGSVKSPYTIFQEAGTNLVRLRLWHNPTWTNYSNFNDVQLAIQKSKSAGMKVLLDFHYSDTWADPGKQIIPAAWKNIDQLQSLGDSIYNYTYTSLAKLAKNNLLPEIVQVGNEINSEILQHEEAGTSIDWKRNSFLIKKGIQAVRDLSLQENKTIEIMLHIAQPENALWWFEEAFKNEITDFDWIGLSYYPKWSSYNLDNLQTPIESLIATYSKKLMIVETAYPFSLTNQDMANNILNSSALIDGFPATEEGQYGYLAKLKTVVKNAGGNGVIYWEPAWVSTECSTLWGKGSHWENAALFDENSQPTKGMLFYKSAMVE